ncbi:MAG: hypothetical protein AAF481_01810 [Acidobacteriota bacterium]
MKKITVLSALILLTLSPFALAEAPVDCKPTAIDATAPNIAALLAQGQVQALGAPVTRLNTIGTRVVKESSQPFIIRNRDGMAIGGGTTTCEATCTGSWCGVSGCDPDEGGCSACSCNGNCSSECTCKKTTTAETAPTPVNPRNVPREPSFR